jgi:hypothetical protein
MSASWDSGTVKTFSPTPAAGKGIPYTDVLDAQVEIVAMQTAFISGWARASAYNSAAQSVPDATATALTFDSEDFDAGSMHSTSVNTSRITIPASKGGVYLILGGAGFAPSATGYRQLDIKKNGATTLTTITVPSNTGGSPTGVFQVHFIVTLAAGDYVELIATQNSGGALNVGSATRALAAFLQVARLW